MGKPRFLISNKITAASMITPSSQAIGVVTRVQKEAAGLATMVATGTSVSLDERDYLVEIDNPGSGLVGSATFSWSNTGGIAFNGNGIPTAASPIALGEGITVSFPIPIGQGTAPHLLLNDRFRFRAMMPFGRARLLDMDRDTEWRSGLAVGSRRRDGAVVLDINLGVAQAVDVVALLDHNLTVGAIVKIQGFDGPPAPLVMPPVLVEETLTVAHPGMIRYLTTTPRSHRYWRLYILDPLIDPTNEDEYIRLGSLYLGGYTELAAHHSPGVRHEMVRLGGHGQLPSGRWRSGLSAAVPAYEMDWEIVTGSDRDLLISVFEATIAESELRVRPFWFHYDSADVTAGLHLVEWDGLLEYAHVRGTVIPRWEVPVRLVATPRLIGTA